CSKGARGNGSNPPIDRNISAESKSEIANDFPAKALLQFPKDIDFGHLLEFVMQRGLQNTDIKDAFPQRDRSRMCSDEITDDLAPAFKHFSFVQSLFQTESLH